MTRRRRIQFVTLYRLVLPDPRGEHAEARTLLEKIGEDHEDRPLRRLVEAMILIADGKPVEAAQRLDQARARPIASFPRSTP